MSIRILCKKCGSSIWTILEPCPSCGYQHKLTKYGKKVQEYCRLKKKWENIGQITGDITAQFCNKCLEKIKRKIGVTFQELQKDFPEMPLELQDALIHIELDAIGINLTYELYCWYERKREDYLREISEKNGGKEK